MERTYSDALDEIRSRMDIVEIIQSHVLLKKKGANWWGCCPFHNEKTPSFCVSPSKNIYKCFGCGESGDAFTFLMKINNQSFNEVVKDLAKKYGIELPNNYTSTKDSTEKKVQAQKALEAACSLYQELLYEDEAAKNALDYLHSRGITDEIIKEYRIGYTPKDFDTLQKKFAKEFSIEILETAGLVLKTEKGNLVDRFRHRITIPIIDESDNVVAIGARAIDKDQSPKYLNSPDTPLYNKSRILYGINVAKSAIKEDDYTVVMEGYFDVISAQAHGLKNCVAACGTALTIDHLKLISKYSQSRKIFLAFDNDSAGIKATERSSEVIKEAFQGLGIIKSYDTTFTSINNDKYSCEIHVITPPQGKDPDEYIRENGIESYKKYLKSAKLLIDFQIDTVLKNISKSAPVTEKVEVIKKILPLIEEIQNQIVQNEYIKSVATKLGIDETALVKEFNKSKRVEYEVNEDKAPIVTKSSNNSQKAQKNLLSLYLISERNLDYQTLSNLLNDVKFTEKNYTILKDTIDKLACQVNNNKDKLVEALYVHFAEDNDFKEIITDLIYVSDCFENLSEKDLRAVVRDNIHTIQVYQENCKRKELKSKYKNVSDDDEESIKYQMQLREQLKNSLKTGE